MLGSPAAFVAPEVLQKVFQPALAALLPVLHSSEAPPLLAHVATCRSRHVALHASADASHCSVKRSPHERNLQEPAPPRATPVASPALPGSHASFAGGVRACAATPPARLPPASHTASSTLAQPRSPRGAAGGACPRGAAGIVPHAPRPGLGRTLGEREWLAASSRPTGAPARRGNATSAAASAAVPGGGAPPARSVTELVEEVVSCAAQRTPARGGGGGDGAQQAVVAAGVLDGLAARAIERAGELTPEEVRNLCVSFAQLGYFNVAFKSAMADAVISRLGDFDPPLLADTAWAFGKLQHYDYKLFSSLIPHLKAHAAEFDASGLAKMLWAFARVGYQDEMLLTLVHQVGQRLEERADSKSIADVIYATAQLGWADDRVSVLVADHVAHNLQAFNGETLSKVMWGLAHCGYDDEQLIHVMSMRALELLTEGGALSPHDLARVMTSVGEWGYHDHAFLKGVAEAVSPALLAGLSPDQLQAVVVAFNKLNFSSPAVAQLASALSVRLPSLTPEFPGWGEDDGAQTRTRREAGIPPWAAEAVTFK